MTLWRSRMVPGAEPVTAIQPAGDGAALELTVAGMSGPPLVVVRVERDEVRDLVQSLDDWLYDSRPT